MYRLHLFIAIIYLNHNCKKNKMTYTIEWIPNNIFRKKLYIVYNGRYADVVNFFSLCF